MSDECDEATRNFEAARSDLQTAESRHQNAVSVLEQAERDLLIAQGVRAVAVQGVDAALRLVSNAEHNTAGEMDWESKLASARQQHDLAVSEESAASYRVTLAEGRVSLSKQDASTAATEVTSSTYNTQKLEQIKWDNCK